MKHTFRRILALVLAICLFAALGTVALADNVGNSEQYDDTMGNPSPPRVEAPRAIVSSSTRARRISLSPTAPPPPPARP